MDPQQVIDQYDAFAKSVYCAWQEKAKKAALSDNEMKKYVIHQASTSGWGANMLSKQDVVSYQTLAYGALKISFDHISRLQFEEAVPFIRAVVERALDLLESEEHWVKEMAAATATGMNTRPEADHAAKWCLVGVITRAQYDLRLTDDYTADAALNEARRRVCRAISYFFEKAMAEDHHTAIPAWNDHPDTTFEDVRLWLKSMFDRLD